MTPQAPHTAGMAGIPRPKPPAGKSLFSQHYLEHRLPEYAEWQDDALPAFEPLRALWARAKAFGVSWNEAQTEDEFIRPALEALGWTFTVQTKSQREGSVVRPDYALFVNQAAKDAAHPQQGHDEGFYAAYGLTPVDVALMWRTAPPRMPLPEPTSMQPEPIAK